MTVVALPPSTGYLPGRPHGFQGRGSAPTMGRHELVASRWCLCAARCIHQLPNGKGVWRSAIPTEAAGANQAWQVMSVRRRFIRVKDEENGKGFRALDGSRTHSAVMCSLFVRFVVGPGS